jgi:phosphate starvation-inducible protein PhoH
LNPANFEYDDDKWQKIVENMSQGKQDPREAIAQLKAQTDERLEQLRQQFEAQENEKDRQNQLVIAAIDERMNSTQLTSEERQNLEKIKATLAGKAIEVRAQKEITRDNQLLDLHKHNADIIKKPGVEPPGRARPGQAFNA